MHGLSVVRPSLNGRPDNPVAKVDDSAARPRSREAFGAVDRRRFWMAQARHHLARARDWKLRFGSFAHSVAVHWYEFEMAEVARYRRYCRELGGAQ